MRLPQLLEREAPLAQAAAALRRACIGQGQLLLVSGEAGVGKSSLLAALQQQAQAQGLRCRLARCEPQQVAQALAPLRSLGLPATAQSPTERLEALLREWEGGGLLIVEDLHWADEATLDLLRLLARRVPELPLLLALSRREEDSDDGGALLRLLAALPPAATARIALAPLSPAAVAQLCSENGRSSAAAAQLHALSGGNPFFVTEWLACALPDAGAGVPSSVRDAVLARLQQLPANARQALQRLALLPDGAPPALALDLLPEGCGADDIDLCVQRGLLKLEGERLRLRHELARRAVAEALPPLARRSAHAALLDALRGHAPDASLAHHAEAAGDLEALRRHAAPAARQAAAAGAHREAALHWNRLRQLCAQLPLQEQAELQECWSYESGLAEGISAEVLSARQRAVALWNQLGRRDKVGLNLRWLSRLHWYLGDMALAEQYAAQAVAALEAVDAPLERAWAYSTRAHLGLLQQRPADALLWGRRAVQLATRIQANDVLAHALNLVGTAGLQTGQDDAQAQLQRSLALALAGGFHEQAARSYATLASDALLRKDFGAAERWLDEAIAFGERYGLDGRLVYLLGWQAQLRLEQGRWAEAEQLADALLARPRLHALARLPAQTLRARLQLRRGDARGPLALRTALALLPAGGDALRLLPLRLAEVESAWLSGHLPAAQAALQALPPAAQLSPHAWVAGEIAVWQQRCGESALPSALQLAEPWALELAGDYAAAARAWALLGAPYEAALALLAGARQQPRVEWLAEAANLLADLGAQRALAAVRELARHQGFSLPPRPSGPRAAARAHPRGLTAREQQVLALLADGAGNASIGAQLALAPRTVEHHVSAVLAKLGAASRSEAVALAWREQLLGAG